MNVAAVALLVVTGHIIQVLSMNVNLRVLQVTVEFLWWWWVSGGVCTVIFMSNPPAVFRLRCGGVVLSLGL